MTIWHLFEYAAWILSVLVAGWLLRDAFKVGRDYDEEFLVHTIEDLGDEADWQAGDGGRSQS